MKYVYGPVPSRRLGQSLGIDTIPLKTCNWNCVYCQLGRTEPLTNERKAILGHIAKVVHPAEGSFDLSGYEDIVDAVIAIITRHPMRQGELERTLGPWSPGQVSQALADLAASGRAQVVEHNGMRFWSAEPARYPDEAQSRRTITGCRKRSKREPD
jgi:hypothetical protein